MTRPERYVLEEGTQAWDGEVDSNFEMLTDGPLPLHSEANTTDLNNNFNPADYDECIVSVAGVLYISDGVSWSVYRQAANVADSTAVTVSEMATDFNELLTSLKNAGIMATS